MEHDDFLKKVYGDSEPPCTMTTYATREEWLEARRAGGIGSSDAPAALGLSRFQSPLGLFHEKLGLQRELDEGAQQAREERLRWGQILEGPIGQMYAERTGRTVLRPPAHSLFFSKTHDFLIASPDAVVLDPNRDGPGGLEIKNVGEFMADEWEDGVPDDYVIQHQEQLAVLGFSWGSVAVLIGGQRFAFADIDRDQGLIDLFVPKLGAFWRDVLAGNAPEAGARDGELLKRLYPGTTGEIVNLDADFMEWDEKREAAAEGMKKLKAIKDEAENRIRAALGEAIGGVLPNGVTYTNKPQTRAGYTVAPTTFKVLRRGGTKLKKQADKAAAMPAPIREDEF